MALLVKSIADMICEQGADVVNDVIASFSCRYNDEIDELGMQLTQPTTTC